MSTAASESLPRWGVCLVASCREAARDTGVCDAHGGRDVDTRPGTCYRAGCHGPSRFLSAFCSDACTAAYLALPAAEREPARYAERLAQTAQEYGPLGGGQR